MPLNSSKFLFEALTYDDVLLVPAYSEVLPRETSTLGYLTKNIKLNIPIISAAMDTVTDARMAIVGEKLLKRTFVMLFEGGLEWDARAKAPHQCRFAHPRIADHAN